MPAYEALATSIWVAAEIRQPGGIGPRGNRVRVGTHGLGGHVRRVRGGHSACGSAPPCWILATSTAHCDFAPQPAGVMSAMGKRSRVRLHSGGISPGLVRLRKRGASERATAPGRDIRDIGPDKGPKSCRICAESVVRPRSARCDGCIADETLVKEVRRALARLGLPPLGKAVPLASPMSKKRRRAEAALQRLGRKSAAGLSARPTGAARGPAPARSAAPQATPTCIQCFVTLPTTGQCDNCT